MAGLVIFTLASLAGGLATSSAAPAGRSRSPGRRRRHRLARRAGGDRGSFPEGRERVRALSIFTAVTMGGSSLGLVLGGVITQLASWRWVFFVNVPIGIAVVALAPRLLAASQRQRGRFDAAGAITSTAGMSALVYGFISVASHGWTATISLGSFAAAVILLTAFALIETRSSQPITPLWLLRDPSRAASYVARLLLVAGMFGSFFFLTQFVQEVLRFSPLKAGLSFVPMTAALFGTSRLAPRLVARYGPKPLMVAGLLPVVAGMAWLGQLTTGTELLPRRSDPDAAAGHRHGRGLRAAHHGIAGRNPAEGVRRRGQHGERDAAGRRRPRAGHPGHDLRHGEPRGGPAPDCRGERGGPGAARPGARHGGGLHCGRDLRRDRRWS